MFGQDVADAVTTSSQMTEVVNLRVVRKRAARSNAAQTAAENRLIHGAPKAERDETTAHRKRNKRLLDLHKIERGDRR